MVVDAAPANDPSARRATTDPEPTGCASTPTEVSTPEMDAVSAALAMDAIPVRLIDDAISTVAAIPTSRFSQFPDAIR